VPTGADGCYRATMGLLTFPAGERYDRLPLSSPASAGRAFLMGYPMNATYDPNKQGWGFASVVVLLTCGLLYTAYSIHERTYIHPRDPMNVQVYHDRDKNGGESHGAKSEGAEGEKKGEAKAEAGAEKH